MYEGCHIRENSPDAIGHATYKNASQNTYSCTNTIDVNCDHDVHVVSTLQGNGDVKNWVEVLSLGDVNVVISTSGTGNKSLVLVLLNTYPMNWILDIPGGVVIEKIIMVNT